MKKCLLIVFALFLSGQFVTSQQMVTRKVEPFTKLYVGDKVFIQLIKSDHESLAIKAEGIDPGGITSVVENNTLRIRIEGAPFNKKKIQINLYFKELKEMDINNGAEVTTTSLFKADTLLVTLKSGGSLYLDADIQYLKSKVVEGALLNAEGYATVQDIIVATYATVSNYNLESEIISIKASSGGKAKINVESKLNAETSSGGYISYKGNPVEKNIQANPLTSVVVYME
jgi:hypothetical protein